MAVGAVIEQKNLSLEETLERGALAEKLGAQALWVVQLPNQRDSSMMLAGLAASTHRVTVGAGILPAYTRPPVVMAQTALTLDELSGGRTILGLGLGHRLIGEWMLGGTPGPPVDSMREYLTVVTALIRHGEVSISGRWFSGHASYSAPRRTELPVYVGAFGPRMLELAGELADGAILWMCGPEYVRDHVMPALRAGWARRKSSADGFPVVVMMSAVASTDADEDREDFRAYLAAYLRVPTYRNLFEASGFGADVREGRASDAMVSALAAIGSEQEIQKRMAAYYDAGVTQVAVSPTGRAHVDRDLFLDTLRAALGS